jgi:hypothetical protein
MTTIKEIQDLIFIYKDRGNRNDKTYLLKILRFEVKILKKDLKGGLK